MSNVAAEPGFSNWMKFWAVVRLAWGGLLIAGIAHGLISRHDMLYGSLGGLTVLVLLETVLVRERRSPFFDRLRPRPK